MKISNSYNQQQKYTNFGAQIKSNFYLRKSVGQIAEKGTLEDKGLMVKLLNMIKNDTNMKTFEMNMDIISFSNKTVKYRFNIDNGEKELSPGLPFVNPSAFRDSADSNFLTELSWFIKDNYGEKVYNQAVKTASKYSPKYILSSLTSIKRQISQ